MVDNFNFTYFCNSTLLLWLWLSQIINFLIFKKKSFKKLSHTTSLFYVLNYFQKVLKNNI